MNGLFKLVASLHFFAATIIAHDNPGQAGVVAVCGVGYALLAIAQKES